MIQILFLVLFSFAISGCSAINNSGSSNDTTVNLTGNWQWQARHNNKIVSHGRFEITDTNGHLEGTQVVAISNKLIPGREVLTGNAAELRFPLKGLRKKYSGNFEVYGENDEVFVSSKFTSAEGGRIMKGKAMQVVKSPTPIYSASMNNAKAVNQKTLGNTYKYGYTWSAVRI